MWPFKKTGWQTYRWNSTIGKWVPADQFEENPKVRRKQNTRARRETKAAADLWREFREAPVRRSRKINIEWPKALMVMGSVQLIAYVTTHGNKVVPYEHEFAPCSQPLLCAGKKPGQLFLIGNGFKVNAHGIVDIDRQGRRRRHTPLLKVVRRR